MPLPRVKRGRRVAEHPDAGRRSDHGRPIADHGLLQALALDLRRLARYVPQLELVFTHPQATSRRPGRNPRAPLSTTVQRYRLEASQRKSTCSSGRVREVFESPVSLARGDLADLGEHDRVTLVELVHRAIDRFIGERGPAQESPGPAETGGSGPFAVVHEADDHYAVGIGERALALPVRIAGEGAGALPTPHRAAAVGSDGGLGPERSGEPANRLAANVAQPAADQQPDVLLPDAGCAERIDRVPGGDLGGECLAEGGHERLSVF